MGALVSLSIVAIAGTYVWSKVYERKDRLAFMALRSHREIAADAANPGVSNPTGKPAA